MLKICDKNINYPLWSNKLPQVWWLYKTQMYHLSFFECEGCIHIDLLCSGSRKLYYNCNPGCCIRCSWCSSKLTGCYRIQCHSCRTRVCTPWISLVVPDTWPSPQRSPDLSTQGQQRLFLLISLTSSISGLYTLFQRAHLCPIYPG